MFDLLFGLIGFVFKNFFLIVGVGVLISIIHAIMTQNRQDVILNKVSSLVLLAGFLLHSFLYWGITSGPDFFEYLARCVLPAAAALLVGGGIHESSPGVRNELTAIGITYAVCYLVVLIFNNWIIRIITLALGLGVVLFVFTNVAKQELMDFHTNDELGDSEVVRELYEEGYRPTHYKDVSRKGQKVRSNLRRHGVDED